MNFCLGEHFLVSLPVVPCTFYVILCNSHELCSTKQEPFCGALMDFQPFNNIIYTARMVFYSLTNCHKNYKTNYIIIFINVRTSFSLNLKVYKCVEKMAAKSLLVLTLLKVKHHTIAPSEEILVTV